MPTGGIAMPAMLPMLRALAVHPSNVHCANYSAARWRNPHAAGDVVKHPAESEAGI